MNYRDYAVLSFLALMIELAIFSVVYRMDQLFYSMYQSVDFPLTWTRSMDSSGLTVTILLTLAAFLFFLFKMIYKMRKDKDK